MILRLDALAFGGEAVGRDAGGRVVFVPGGAPGDLVEVRLTDEKKRFARGEILRVVEPGAARVAPECPLADRCGGCPWMHVSREAQLAAKQEIVRRALAKTALEVRQSAAPVPPVGYRARARWTRQGSRVGYTARRSHQIVDVPRCPALVPELEAAMLAERDQLADGESLSGLAAPDGRTQVVLGEARGGELDLGEGLFGDAGGFQQASWAGNQLLRLLVKEAVGPVESVLELYAGSGNFTRDLLALAKAGVAVEGEPRAATRLSRMVKPHRGWRALSSPVARAVAELGARRFDVVVLDPPRAGAAEVIARLPELAPRLVYVSCDPMTLGRDLERLDGTGWAQPVDMTPHTSHVEVVVYMQSTRLK
jgi:23S rRNA (uracil1939-C5)-methyltransferase